MSKFLYSLGLMSGTSMDGIDVSIIKSDGKQFLEIIDDLYVSYDDKLRLKLRKIVDLCTSKTQFKNLSKDIKKLEKEVTFCHERACKLIMKKNKNIKINLISFPGQTILHKPQKGYSIQIGDAKLLSKLTKITVISNFRENDIVNGGQGAPLTPLYHQLILKKIKANFPSIFINIGGISNITYAKSKNKIIGFDTGPGNCLIDKWIKKKYVYKNFDKNGQIALSGKVNEGILNKLLKNSYYKKKPPKSLDLKDLDLSCVKKINFKDGVTTLSMLTARTICMEVRKLDEFPKLILIAGGGRKNKFLIKNLKKILNKKIFLIDKFNFNGDFVESQAFAYLAIRSYLKKFITFPGTTGVKKPCLGGLRYKN